MKEGDFFFFWGGGQNILWPSYIFSGGSGSYNLAWSTPSTVIYWRIV